MLFRKRQLNLLLFTILLFTLVLGVGCSGTGPSPGSAPPQEQVPVVNFEDAGDAPDVAETPEPEGILTAHFIDVGQGDACLVELPGGGTILIDGGGRAATDTLLQYLQAQSIDRIDHLIATHPHEDHIGGLIGVVAELEIGKVYMPRVVHTTKTFEELLETIKEKGLKITAARTGVEIEAGDGVEAVFVAPCREDYEDLNDHSAVLKLRFGQASFLFTGDAERQSEMDMLNSGTDLMAQILKVGHHGSSTSTSHEFLEAVNPEVAVISAGKDNSYGHPHEEVVDRLASFGVEILRTDLMGDIVVTADAQGMLSILTAADYLEGSSAD